MVMLKKNAAVFGAGVVAIATCTAGCAMPFATHSGRDFDATKAQTFQKGKTLKTDVIEAMGEPTSTGGNVDGSFIEYQYQTITNTSPFVLFGVGTVDEKMKLCKFIFDAKDKLKDYTCSEGAPNYSNFGK